MTSPPSLRVMWLDHAARVEPLAQLSLGRLAVLRGLKGPACCLGPVQLTSSRVDELTSDCSIIARRLVDFLLTCEGSRWRPRRAGCPAPSWCSARHPSGTRPSPWRAWPAP